MQNSLINLGYTDHLIAFVVVLFILNDRTLHP